MLKLKQPDTMRRRAGGGIVVLIAVGLASAVYAATPAQQATPTMGHADHYTLKLALALDGKPARLHATTCLGPGEYYSVTESGAGQRPPWHGRFTVMPISDGTIEVRGEMSGGPLSGTEHPTMRMKPGEQGTLIIGPTVIGRSEPGAGSKFTGGPQSIRLDLTSTPGC